jgi:hypothetical protein
MMAQKRRTTKPRTSKQEASKRVTHKRLFLVFHETEHEDVKFIGVYSTEALARAAVERSKILPGFRGCPDGFTVDPYLLNKDHWTSGYIP